MKIPKKVNICGKKYTVTKNASQWGGNGSTGKQAIVVGTARNQSNERKFDNYLHEVAELITCEQELRYESNSEDIVFVMTHQQFTGFVGAVASAIYPMVKK